MGDRRNKTHQVPTEHIGSHSSCQTRISQLPATASATTSRTEPNATIGSSAHRNHLAPFSAGLVTSTRGTKRKAWAGLKALGSTLNNGAGAFGPLKSAIDDVHGLIDVFEGMSLSQDHDDPLVKDLDALFSDISRYLGENTPPAMMSCIQDFANGIAKEMELVQNKSQKTGVGRLEWAMKNEEEVAACYQRIHMLLSRLAMNSNLVTWKTIDEQAADRQLRSLPDSPEAKYCSKESTNLGRGECTSNTRVALLQELRAWASDDNAERIYWLNGMAGTGKTTIAYSLCEYLQTTQKLGASFFCSQRLSSCRDVNRIVPSVAYRLSRFSPPFRQALSRLLGGDDEAHNQVLEKQFDDLLVAPLREVKETVPSNVVIVIDALDECDDRDGVGRMLSLLLSHAAGLPVKFFVTSRPEAEIVDRMRDEEAEGVRKELRLHELGRADVQQDIRTYLAAKLARAKLSTAEMEKLTEKCGVLFIYAATVVRYVSDNGFARSRERLRAVLEASSTAPNKCDQGLDTLYTTILSAAFDDNGLEESEAGFMRETLCHIVCAREPLSIDVLAGLLDRDDAAPVRAALRPLQSVLNVSEGSEPVTTLHESFPNYMLNPLRSNGFYCDPRRHHAQMAMRCFELMEVPSPPFNICKLESSYMLDEQVPYIDARVKEAISEALLYACRYWGIHLHVGGAAEDVVGAFYEFLSTRLLLWIEVMNFTKRIAEGVDMLRKIQAWCKDNECSIELQMLAKDASRFAAVVSSSPMSRSTPHIYISALPFWPASRPIAKYYMPRIPGVVKATGPAMARQEHTPVTIQIEPEAYVTCSPNGTHLASRRHDCGLVIWDLRTGRKTAMLPDQYTRHSVAAISYSYNGSYLTLGKDDGSICIWDTQNHAIVGAPLRSPTHDVVHLIVCSPDGTHVASIHWNNKIYIWNRHTGHVIDGSLTDHTQRLRSIVYSPDGAFLACGSYDTIIWICRADTGQSVGNGLRGHTGPVWSVAYSPDGTHIASGSEDRTIRIWNVHTRKTTTSTLVGHTGSVLSVQYSSDGLYIVSGSDDCTVRVWDAHTGQTICQLLDGDSNQKVTEVFWSSDGTQILAYSNNGAIYIWDSSIITAPSQPQLDHVRDTTAVASHSSDARLVASSFDLDTASIRDIQADQLSAWSPECHTSWILSVTYSPDGTYIVSGSADHTVQIRDAQTGRMIGQPLKGHTDHINSVACSADGAYIASGSDDKTIRIWDARTSKLVGSPLEGHTSYIYSVSYSPCGAYIVSGSLDHTIRIWNVQTGVTVMPPLEGHTDSIWSVSYSPGGSYIASGSHDKTVRIWNAHTGKAVVKPLTGHTERVQLVMYSSDGLYIVSASHNTVCVWDAYTGDMIHQQTMLSYDHIHCIPIMPPNSTPISVSFFRGAIRISHAHTARQFDQPFGVTVNDLFSRHAFSPNGTQIVSGYLDGTIRVWSVRTRRIMNAWMESNGNQQCVVEPCSGNTCTFGSGWDTWELDEGGWIVTKPHSQRLVWVPLALRKSLVYPHNTLTILKHPELHLDFSNAKLGEDWQLCYSLTKVSP